MRKRDVFQVFIAGEWCTCKKAQVQPSKTGDSWLHYELRDGTIGIVRPSKWRLKPTKEKAGS